MTDYINYIKQSSDKELALELSGGMMIQFDEEGISDLIGIVRDIEDERYGRWRDPENPDYVVYPDGLTADGDRVVTVICLSDGRTGQSTDKDITDVLGLTDLQSTADRYFKANKRVQPWHRALPSEAWRVTTSDGDSELMLVGGQHPDWVFYNEDLMLAITSEKITDAERVY